MNQFWTGILGGLVGSILTVVITKLLDIFQSSKQHQYNLEQKFFDKKLTAAETAMTQYSILSNALTNLSVFYDRLNNDSNDIEDSLLSDLLSQCQRQIEQVNNSSFILANSISLYFDFQNEFNQNIVVKEFYALLGRLGPLSDYNKFCFEKYLEYRGTINEAAALHIYNESEVQFEAGLKEISENMATFSDRIQTMMKEIRLEMSRFEY